MEDDREISSLVQEAQAGSRDAFEAIYRHYAARIYNFLLRLLDSREEAEDITQQTFLIALKQLGTLRDPAQMEAWVYRIARNEVYQKYRRQRKKIESLGEEPQGDSFSGPDLSEPRLFANPEKAFLNTELRGVLHSVLGSLPLKLREVFVMGVVQGMSYKDISSIVGRSVLSVKTDIYRARLMAKDELGKYINLRPTIK